MLNSSNPFSAVDIVTLKFENQELWVYLVQLTKPSLIDQWALPGSLVHSTETLEDATQRIYTESTNQTPNIIEQLYTFSDTNRDPRSRSIATAYLTFPIKNNSDFIPCSKYKKGKWWNIKEIQNLAYDHNKIIKLAIDRISAKLNYTTIAFYLLDKAFTLSEIQNLYEYFSQKPIDKRNFRTKILSLDIIKETGKMKSGQFRPAKLYTAKNNEIKIISLFS